MHEGCSSQFVCMSVNTPMPPYDVCTTNRTYHSSLYWTPKVFSGWILLKTFFLESQFFFVFALPSLPFAVLVWYIGVGTKFALGGPLSVMPSVQIIKLITCTQHILMINNSQQTIILRTNTIYRFAHYIEAQKFSGITHFLNYFLFCQFL